VISQDVARATPSAGFGYQKHNARGAEYRDSEGPANVFAHDMARSIKSDNYFSLVGPGTLGGPARYSKIEFMSYRKRVLKRLQGLVSKRLRK
jgi:hypothetical protein